MANVVAEPPRLLPEKAEQHAAHYEPNYAGHGCRAGSCIEQHRLAADLVRVVPAEKRKRSEMKFCGLNDSSEEAAERDDLRKEHPQEI